VVVLLLPLLQTSEAHADDFLLLNSYPTQGQILEPSDLVTNPVYLKFSHPVDHISAQGIRFLDKNTNDNCQLNQCGIIEFAENDTKLIWHPNGPGFLFQPGGYFEIQIGVTDTSGNRLPMTYIDFSIDKCQPTASLTVTYNNWKNCVCGSLGFNCHFDGSGNGITLTGGLTNPGCGANIAVDVKGWLELPDGSLLPLFNPHTTVQLTPGDSISGDLLSYTFLGSEPVGNYNFFLRLVNPLTGDLYSTTTTRVPFGVCPAIF
jgi:hypothetical protein